MARVGYARVSTQEQSLDMQIDALEKAGCEKIFKEKISGTKDDRKELKKCLDYLRKGDVLVVYKLDRLGRSTRKLLEITDELELRGIDFISVNDNMDTTTAIGKAMFRMLAVLSEMERDLIPERTRAGLEAARARGRKGGRPKTDSKILDKAIRLYKTKEYSVKEITEMTGVSKAKLYQALKEV
ncbi:recombinase family protein [Neobacillus ginsengisoli]|uniref:DNA invertase Pin-like site-specific DNA recombinase n=1 Tax=Neobacillus ginsengisoli TaxID=904295 RepID=A0ABT9XT33_9BACI|nr:recombinase family protein [Neobacillus ginsengisoli]MDQ0198684.1 DNA invertase Pin-like site-specific DNA recombinase [Neobacillus ginsengisoli]